MAGKSPIPVNLYNATLLMKTEVAACHPLFPPMS
ncbi:hypothetical protein SAMN05216604_10923 [Pseudomonas agarici]|nr:hypothetical protein SAMN05216604_10923 [Pseudomonas agarici]